MLGRAADVLPEHETWDSPKGAHKDCHERVTIADGKFVLEHHLVCEIEYQVDADAIAVEAFCTTLRPGKSFSRMSDRPTGSNIGSVSR